MTREKIKQKIKNINDNIGFLEEERNKSISWYAKRISSYLGELIDLEKQLAELEVEVYKPYYLHNFGGYCEYPWQTEFRERHNAGEELKKIISEENAKQGWTVDWSHYSRQYKYFLARNTYRKGADIHITQLTQQLSDEEYFSEKSSKDQDFLAKIKPLWLKWKGITE